MKFDQLRLLLHKISGFGSRNDFHSHLYYSKAMPIWRTTDPSCPLQISAAELFRRISPVGDRNVSIVPILDQWVEEGRYVDQHGLKNIIKQLRYYNRYDHALEVSMWMTDNRYFELTSVNAAIRLELISKVQGYKQAEKYFDNLSRELKDIHVYSALLNCYVTTQCVEKAEEVMQKMRDMGYAKKTVEFNLMLTLYYKTRNMEKLDALLQEMEENGIVHDKFTSGILFSAYASVRDIEKMDKIVAGMESDPNVDFDWNSYSAAAAGYTKAGFLDKAIEMLKKAEACLISNPKFTAYNHLLTQYATIGRKDAVVRIWSLYKKYKVYNQGYKCILMSLGKLGDLEMAEKIFDEWESRGLTYDMNVPNVMIRAYSKKGLIEKAEALIERAISKGGKPNAGTWQHLAEGYLENEQPQRAVEMMKKAIVISETGWKPYNVLFNACLEYLEQVGDTVQTEEFANLLQAKDRMNIVSSD